MIQFGAEIKQVKTMADSSIRLVLDLQEYATTEAKALMDLKRDAPFVAVVIAPVTNAPDQEAKSLC